MTEGSNPPWFIFILFVLFLPGYLTLSVTWAPNLEWNTESNWADNNLPKNGTRIIFPVEMRLSVGLPAFNFPLDIAGLELPRDGVLALPQSGIITISPTESSTKTVQWSPEGPLLWVDPNNWLSERSSRAVPHLERIPCQDDVVVLPESKRIFSIKLPRTLGTKVRAVRINNDSGDLAPWEWGAKVRTEREFSGGSMTVGYTGIQSCSNCPCQPPQVGREILEEVCQTRGGSCGNLECEYPLKIEGHCCYYCGGRIILPDTTSLSLLKTLANSALRDRESSLSWYTRRRWDSKTEILIAGKNGYSMTDVVTGVETLTSVLKDNQIVPLSSETTGTEVNISESAAVFGSLFGALLIVILLLLVAFPYFGYSIPQIATESWRGFQELRNGDVADVIGSGRAGGTVIRKPFRFAKFENAPESEVELATSSSAIPVAREVNEDEDENYDGEEGGGGGGGRFANPLYRSGRKAPPESQTFSALKKIHADLNPDDEIDLEIDT